MKDIKIVISSAIKIIKEYECLYLIPSDNMIGYKTSIIEELFQRRITEEKAEQILFEYLNNNYVPLISKYNNSYSWGTNEFSALLSFLYNNKSVNIDDFLKKVDLKNGELKEDELILKEDIPKKMKQYCYEGGKVLKSLVEKRIKEIELFNDKIIPDCSEQNEIIEMMDIDNNLTTDLNLTPDIETIIMLGKKSNPDLYYVKNVNSLEIHIMDSYHGYTIHKL